MSCIRVEVVRAERGRVDAVSVELPAGACVGDALKACGMKGDVIGVFGKRADLATPLADGDRVEIYRPLALDPKERRRQRARRRAKKTRV